MKAGCRTTWAQHMNKLHSATWLAITLALSGCFQDSTGEKVGGITRLSHDGFMPFCKTWEGEIIRGGLSNGSGVFGAPFHFTVQGDELVQKVKQALESQKEVK